MPRYFLDSSALVKRFHQESGSNNVDRLFQLAENRILISRLAIVELHSAFARLVREGVITKTDFDVIIARLEQDVVSGIITVAALSSRRLQDAADIFATVGVTTPVRTLDAIHLVTAQALHGRSRIAAFVAADKALLSAAAVCGLEVVDVG